MKDNYSSLTALRYRSYFAIALVSWWLLTLFLWLGLGNDESFWLLNSFHGSAANQFFKYFTHTGDGLFALMLVVIFWFTGRRQLALVLLGGYAASGIAAQLIKYLVPQPRPYIHFMAQGKQIQMVDGATLLGSHSSFPSGHTATAFAIATTLVLLSGGARRYWWLVFLWAAVVGYSRIYLGNHFVGDVCVGSFLGVASAVAAYWAYKRWQASLHH